MLMDYKRLFCALRRRPASLQFRAMEHSRPRPRRQVSCILSLHDFVFCFKAHTYLVSVQASSLNHLSACAVLILSRGGQHSFHGGNLDVLGLVIAVEPFVQGYCLGFLTVGQ